MIAKEHELKDATILHKPALARFEGGGLAIFLDGEAPNWAALDARGARLYEFFDGKRALGEVRRLHEASSGADSGEAWLDVQSLARGLVRAGMLSFSPFRRPRYEGRAKHLEPKRLSEFWVHLLQTCNISCTHCLVSSGPSGEAGPSTAFLLDAIGQAHALGARRFYFTGGEPFARPDLVELIRFVVDEKRSDLVVMTNATLLSEDRLAALEPFDVERPYRAVQEFYGKAAALPQKELCCPVKYSEDEVGHIPQDVLDRFYGCGSPISSAGVREGETTLDLGSGAGIDCFIAAKKVGPKGRVIGVDMTAEMLAVARRCQTDVAARLGFDVVDFREGYLEKVPVPDKSVDLVTSNCVINLSPDKSKVFAEIWRVLKDHGRLVVADIVADRPVPLNLQAHKDLWGECISGSLSEEEFLAALERAGFYGVSVLKRTFWKDVAGFKFFSLTVRAFKLEAVPGGAARTALYLGPHKAVIDEDGNLFPRYEPVAVSPTAAARLTKPPFAGSFFVSGDPLAVLALDEACCAPGESCC